MRSDSLIGSFKVRTFIIGSIIIRLYDDRNVYKLSIYCTELLKIKITAIVHSLHLYFCISLLRCYFCKSYKEAEFDDV